eukprot:gnl/TRDRNA2_/TRDRNA2_73683_c0_seq1.p1 gnl/TRDRNA2_/TRDRNA2_73683_c0~~gnl/TRDRNA2_/TRDRNA2_73683_c0_seq1.p1  ORF type:complete len:230 (+),score=25.43 gnl/TRDRNA2_/TRDRNA2_73683_c0_seq1:2-691(+)
MHDLGLKRGWVTDCDDPLAAAQATSRVEQPKDSPAAGCVNPPERMQFVTKPNAGPGDTVKAECVSGFEGSQRFWNVTCARNDVWRPHGGDCKPMFCEAPLDTLGVWQGRRRYNATLTLVCPDGYMPTGGPAEILCPWLPPVARCTTKAGSASRWQHRLHYGNGGVLAKFLCLIVIGGLVMLICCGDPRLASLPGSGRPIEADHDRILEQDADALRPGRRNECSTNNPVE